MKHILKLQTIGDPLLRANYVRQFKRELTKELQPPYQSPTVTGALVGELKGFMARTAIFQKELSSLLGCSQQLVCDLLSGHSLRFNRKGFFSVKSWTSHLIRRPFVASI